MKTTEEVVIDRAVALLHELNVWPRDFKTLVNGIVEKRARQLEAVDLPNEAAHWRALQYSTALK